MNADFVLRFLDAYRPRFICAKCLVAAIGNNVMAVSEAINAAIAAGRAEAMRLACFHCGLTHTVVRLRSPQPAD